MDNATVTGKGLARFLLTTKRAGDEHDISLVKLSGLWKKSQLLAVMLAIAFVSPAGLAPTVELACKQQLLISAWKAGCF